MSWFGFRFFGRVYRPLWFIPSLFCAHRFKHIETFYGDEILFRDCRSVFGCAKCRCVVRSNGVWHRSMS